MEEVYPITYVSVLAVGNDVTELAYPAIVSSLSLAGNVSLVQNAGPENVWVMRAHCG